MAVACQIAYKPPKREISKKHYFVRHMLEPHVCVFMNRTLNTRTDNLEWTEYFTAVNKTFFNMWLQHTKYLTMLNKKNVTAEQKDGQIQQKKFVTIVNQNFWLRNKRYIHTSPFYETNNMHQSNAKKQKKYRKILMTLFFWGRDFDDIVKSLHSVMLTSLKTCRHIALLECMMSRHRSILSNILRAHRISMLNSGSSI